MAVNLGLKGGFGDLRQFFLRKRDWGRQPGPKEWLNLFQQVSCISGGGNLPLCPFLKGWSISFELLIRKNGS
jgi:hypothetical protein